jgi:hypothetical protein
MIYFARFWFVHVGGPTNQVAFLESQPIHETQQLSNQTLSPGKGHLELIRRS